MYGFKKSPLRSSVDPPVTRGNASNPFDSNDELDLKKPTPSSRKPPSSSTNLLDDDDPSSSEGLSSSSTKYQVTTYAQRNKYKNDLRDSGGLESQSVQELEGYAVYKAEETTDTVNNCLRIAEDMRGEATKTLNALHHQGEQIYRTHVTVTEIDHHLSRGEKLLGSLGGIFSKPWKAKARKLTGPVTTRDETVARKANHLEQKEKLGLVSAPNGRPKTRTPLPEPTNALQKVECEKTKQDEALSDLSNVLGELKEMAIDMGKEIDGQIGALEPMDKDVDELVIGVKYANQRGSKLLGK